MKSKPEKILLDKEQWKSLVVDTLYNVLSLASSSKILLDENIKENKDVLYEHPHVAAGLYIFSIEEFGKALILQSYKILDNKVEIKYRNEFRNHTIKFEKALNVLPDECKILHRGNFGGNFGKGFDIDEYVSIYARFSILYSDLDDDGKTNILPQVNAENLEIGLRKFIEIVEDNLASFNTTTH